MKPKRSLWAAMEERLVPYFGIGIIALSFSLLSCTSQRQVEQTTTPSPAKEMTRKSESPSTIKETPQTEKLAK